MRNGNGSIPLSRSIPSERTLSNLHHWRSACHTGGPVGPGAPEFHSPQPEGVATLFRRAGGPKGRFSKFCATGFGSGGDPCASPRANNA
jgi:hypothetical protein